MPLGEPQILDLKEEDIRWRLELEDEGRRTAFLPNLGQQRVPILDVYYNGIHGVQIGLNVPHVPHNPALFTELKKGFKDMYNRGNGYIHSISDKVFLACLQIMFQDPSISKFTFPRLNSFNIHLSDPYLISLLDKDETIHTQRRMHALINRSEGKASYELFREICNNPINYRLALEFLEPSQVDTFYESIKEMVMRKEREKELDIQSREGFKAIKKEVARLQGMGVNVFGIQQETQRVEKKIRTGKRITLEELSKMHNDFMSNPCQVDLEHPNVSYFADVSRLPTTLHKLANTAYSPEIVTFKVTEPFHDVELIGGGKSRGYIARREIIDTSLFMDDK